MNSLFETVRALRGLACMIPCLRHVARPKGLGSTEQCFNNTYCKKALHMGESTVVKTTALGDIEHNPSRGYEDLPFRGI